MTGQQPKVDKKWLGVNWQLSPTSGWGVLGLNLALQAEQGGRFLPVPLLPTLNPEAVPIQYRTLLDRILSREKTFQEILNRHPGERCRCEFPILHTLGNRLLSNDPAEKIVGNVNLAVIFFEDTLLQPLAREIAKRFLLILAGSNWNKEVLTKNGILNVTAFLQGVDLSLFRPNRKRAAQGKPFVVFSGGKLEYRKGQDIVVAAFRKFRQHHREAILVTAWHNHWPKSMQGIDHKKYVDGQPEVKPDNLLDITSWLEANGVPREASHDIGVAPNHLMPDLYRQVDVAVFPNRCEGGTNLMAMECLASGLPTILSANTGHLDLIDERHCYPLVRQGAVVPVMPFLGTEGWGESDVDEVVEAMERIYRDRQEAEQRGAAAVQFMQDWSWEKRYSELLDHLTKFQ